MPSLPRSVFTLQFLKGIRTNTDPSLQLDGELTRADNCEIDLYGAISKRNGFTKLPRSTFDGYTLTSGQALISYGDELLHFDGYQASAYSAGLSKWISKGVAHSVVPEGVVIQRNDGYQQTNPDSAYNNGVEAYVWIDERGGARYTLVSNGTKLKTDQPLDSSASSVKVTAFSHYFVFSYVVTGSPSTLYYRTIDLNSSNLALSSATSIASLVSTVDAAGGFDCRVVTNAGVDRLFYVYTLNSPTYSTTKYLDTSLVLSSALSETTTFGSSSKGHCIVPSPTGATIYIGKIQAANLMDSYIINFDNTLNHAKVTIYTAGTPTDLRRVTGVADASGATFYFEARNSVTTYDGSYVLTNTFSSAGTAGTVRTLARSVGLVGQAFTYNGLTYIPCAHESTFQPTIFLMDGYGAEVCTIGYETTGGVALNYTLGNVTALDSSTFLFAHETRGKDISVGDTIFSRLGVKRVVLDFASANAFQHVELDNQLIVCGGTPRSYDRNRLTEANFFLYPEDITTVTGHQADGYMTNSGNYLYKVVFSATDAAGNIADSNPSTTISVTLGATDNLVSLTVPTLRLTGRDTGITIDIYRTVNNGTVFYKVTDDLSPFYNNTNADTVAFIDKLSDTDIQSNAILYTQGEKANSAFPTAGVCGSYRSRLFLGRLEDPNLLWFSKESSPGIACEMVDDSAFKVKVDAVGGDMTALAPLGDQLIVFRETAIYGLSGQGPEVSGINNDYFTPPSISQSIGCGYPGVVTSIPTGLIFASKQGIHTLGGDGLQYVGQNVQAYNDGYTFTSADRIPESTQVRFTTAEGALLVHDYQYNTWHVWTGLPAVDADIWNDTHCILQSDGYVRQQGTGYQDDGANYDMLVSTSWYTLQGPGGYFQLDKVYLEGTYLDAHDLTIAIEFDGYQWPSIDAIPDRFVISAANMPTVIGPLNVYDFEVPVYRRCKSFRVHLRASGSGACARWSGLRVELAPLPGNNRLASKRKA